LARGDEGVAESFEDREEEDGVGRLRGEGFVVAVSFLVVTIIRMVNQQEKERNVSQGQGMFRLSGHV
jgi:hypothetical protein